MTGPAAHSCSQRINMATKLQIPSAKLQRCFHRSKLI